MNTLDDNNLARQTALNWSQQLGHLAAERPATRPEAIATLQATSPPPNLDSILERLRQRFRRQQNAADTLRINEFIST